MARTRTRPLPTGGLTEGAALIFAAVLGVASMLLLWLLVNPLTAVLTFASLIGYAVVYTLWLKRATPQNIVIGGAAGAAPPVLGWAAITNSIDPHALLLFLIIFAWTPPHFWALAIARREDYAKVGHPDAAGDARRRVHAAARAAVHHHPGAGDAAALAHRHERPALSAGRAGARCDVPVLRHPPEALGGAGNCR